ncbi:MAG: AAA family ATPase, partial [Patescibacteria group bacterium]|nr:AAA family ATPase [Patescibacteria group bacterium]
MARKKGESEDKGLVPTEPEILRILYQHNPWWINKPIPDIKLKEFKRRDYFKLEEELANNKITAVIGARQVGKTTMLYQLIQKLLSDNNPQSIFFLSLDDQYLNITLRNLNKIFEVYASNILKTPLDELKHRVYFFLDEIQTVQDWEIILKRWYDLGYKIKFIISGSSSINILQGTSESLVGRIKPQIVLPMKFLEYIRLKEQNKLGELTNTTNLEMHKALKYSIMQNKADPFYKICTTALKLFAPFKDKMSVYLNQYLVKGGYPEIAFIDNLALCAENLRNYLQLTLYKDIMRTGKVRDPVALENLVS